MAGVFGRGVYVSEDGGEKWRDSSLGLKGSRNVIHMTAGSQGRLYLCVLDGRGGTGGLYVSGDRGASWKALGAGRLLNVSDVTTDPRKPGRIFAACGENGSSPDGVWRSDDGGSTWKCVLERGKTHGVCVDPRPPHILYACVADWASGGLWASPDGGSTWKEIEGLPYHIINRVAADPKDPRLLWVITAGGGLLRGRPE